MNNLVKATIHGSHRVHAARVGGGVVCGGGNGAKTANWQEDIGAVTCLRCLAILKRRASTQEQAHEPALLETHA
jgi:hypothetical protein